ncbi:hypothetical protein Q5H91_06300 [Sphingomonas sp. KR1UV-12]|uniref:DUF2231 domain-containing protein n=1 Tax=Sphingomonas aurea TaxID=3063994 RepID=A0ABT9EIM2_9SPHN|nr:DUF2231 domain-containing protein [Sphingomonas sp. KR1UV-12]MDP1026815.1 hypothetical protein [Sphingomonas sp. KR1UV-12]
MSARAVRRPFLHPLHAILLAFPTALFATGLANDITYLNSAEMQWSNFAAWAITGALVFGAPVLLWGAIQAFTARQTVWRRRALLYAGLLALMWMAGLVNAFKHSQDAWSSVGTAGLLLSILSTAAALAASWVGHMAVAAEGTMR